VIFSPPCYFGTGIVNNEHVSNCYSHLAFVCQGCLSTHPLSTLDSRIEKAFSNNYNVTPRLRKKYNVKTKWKIRFQM
jgi:hypothetical protein